MFFFLHFDIPAAASCPHEHEPTVVNTMSRSLTFRTCTYRANCSRKRKTREYRQLGPALHKFRAQRAPPQLSNVRTSVRSYSSRGAAKSRKIDIRTFLPGHALATSPAAPRRRVAPNKAAGPPAGRIMDASEKRNRGKPNEA